VPLDLTYFLIALQQVADLDMGALGLVESAWQSSVSTGRMFGWVVAFMGGQRLYLEMEVADVRGGRSPDLEITPLDARQRYPDELENAVTWYRPDHINRRLELAGQFVH